MIYIIIGRDNITHNEWVQHETFEDSVKAAERCNELNELDKGVDVVYRVDTVEPSDGKTITRLYADKEIAKERAALKHKMNAAYGKTVPRQAGKTSAIADYNEMLISQAGGDGDTVKDTDSLHSVHRSEDFTEEELFLRIPYPYKGYTCNECGALVADTGAHVVWHNKLLP